MKVFFLIICALILSFCATSPEVTSPEVTSPKATFPKAAFPKAASPKASSPEATSPEASPEAPKAAPVRNRTSLRAPAKSLPSITPDAGEEAFAAGAIPETAPELFDFIEPPIHILGEGLIPREAMAEFLLWHNAFVDDDFVYTLSTYYIEEAIMEGINHDVAFAQMCLETGFLRYGGLVTADMNNFCGLGAIGPEEPGLHFPDPRTGVRAHIQHLKAYATIEPLNLTLVDPRYYLVRHGSSPTIYGLAGTWAADRTYSEKIDRILERLYQFSF